jgi:hypothetical protein
MFAGASRGMRRSFAAPSSRGYGAQHADEVGHRLAAGQRHTLAYTDGGDYGRRPVARG